MRIHRKLAALSLALALGGPACSAVVSDAAPACTLEGSVVARSHAGNRTGESRTAPARKPVAARIVAVPADGSDGKQAAETDREGRFTLVLAPGTYHVHAESEAGDRTLPVEVLVGPGCPNPIVLTFEKFRP